MINFKTDENLGKVVKNVKLFCSIGVDKVDSLFKLKFAAGGNKFSQLCGFLFESANENIEYKKFSISFVCKLRSHIYRKQQNGSSRWYILKKISDTRVDVLDKKACLVNYGFDVDKFMESDLFKKCLSRFDETLKNGLKDATEFVSTLDTLHKKEGTVYIKAIQSALPLIKRAYVEDKYYQLKDLDAYSELVKSGRTDKDKLDAKLNAIHKSLPGMMDKIKKASDKAQKNDFILQKIKGNESEKIDENDKFKCKVVKVKENGEDAWRVEEASDGSWVATFHDELAANAFAEEYPKLRAEYIDDEVEIESDDNAEAVKKTDECDVEEKELDKDIEESLNEVYS